MEHIKTLIAMFVAALACPDTFCDGAVEIEPRHNLNDLLDAMAMIESGGDPNKVGDNGQAVGMFQIHPIYVRDVNRILGFPAFSLKDRWCPEKSRRMTTYYIRHYGRSLEQMARCHNGGPKGWKKKSTLPYWKKVKAQLGREVVE